MHGWEGIRKKKKDFSYITDGIINDYRQFGKSSILLKLKMHLTFDPIIHFGEYIYRTEMEFPACPGTRGLISVQSPCGRESPGKMPL